MNEIVLLESLSLRQQLCTDKNTSILGKVGHLVFLSGTTFCTVQALSLFYQVELNTLQQVVKRHRSELEQDGYKLFSKNELQNVHAVQFDFKIPNRGLALFPRRAILRLGMLLRDSSIAKQVRSYLLNIEEQSQHTTFPEETLNQIVQQLDTQAGHLIQHAEQFSIQADELKNHAKQLKIQTEMIKALWEEACQSKRRMDFFEKKVETTQERLTALERLAQQFMHQKSEENLSEEQIQLLKERIKKNGSPQKIWSMLKKHFGVKRYNELSKSRFREILDWLEKYEK